MRRNKHQPGKDDSIIKNIEYSLQFTPAERLELLEKMRWFALSVMDEKAHRNREYVRKLKK